jgi:hypothetical protein
MSFIDRLSGAVCIDAGAAIGSKLEQGPSNVQTLPQPLRHPEKAQRLSGPKLARTPWPLRFRGQTTGAAGPRLFVALRRG